MGFVTFVLAVAAFVIALIARRETSALRRELASLKSPQPRREAHEPATVADAAPDLEVAAVPAAVPAAAPQTASPSPAFVLPPEPPVEAPVNAPPPPPPVDSGIPRFEPSPGAPRTPRAWNIDWESLVGVKLFSAIAGIALVLAAVFLFKYSVEHGWLRPPIRAAFGLVSGIALLVVCELKIARNYRVTANAMDGAGIAILYATLFAMYSRWGLIGGAAAFGGMLVVTAVAVFLSTRRNSVFIALLGLVGGFATPALLSSGENRPLALFSYLLLLNGGISWIAYRKRWPLLTALSVILTVIYQWSWIERFLTTGQLALAAAIFLVFAVVAAGSLWPRSSDERTPIFRNIASIGALLPLVFAFFTAIVPEYGVRYNVLFGFLLLMTTGLAAISLWRGPEWLHTVGGIATLVTFFVWLSASYNAASWPWSLLWLGAFVALYLLAALRVRSIAVYTAPALLFVLTGLAIRESAGWSLQFLALFVILAAVAAWSIAKTQVGTLIVGVVLAQLFLAASDGAPPTIQLAAIIAVAGVAIGATMIRPLLVNASITALLMGELAVIVARFGSPRPEFAVLTAAHLALIGALLLVARASGRQVLVPISVAVATAALVTAEPLEASRELLLAWLLYSLFVAYALFVRRDLRGEVEPFVGVTLASAVVFLASYQALETLGYGDVIGLLPVAIAAVLGLILWRAFGAWRADRESGNGSLVLLGAAILAFVTVAIPLQFENEWITIGFAIEAVVLALLRRRIAHRGLLFWVAALVAVVFVRLVLNPAVFDYHPKSATPILNWYLWAYLFSAAAIFVAQWLIPEAERLMRRGFITAATLTLFALLNIEIADFYSPGAIRFDLLDRSLAQGLTYTIAWAVFAIAVLIAGIVFASRGSRIAALALLLVTILKCFLHDLASLGGLYRVASLFGLAVSLVIVGLLLQKFVMLRGRGESPPPANAV